MRFADFRTITRSRTTPATDVAHDVLAVARSLLADVTLPTDGVRLLGVRVEQLAPADDGVQLRLDDDVQRRDAEAAMDSIRQRFGPAALGPASLLRRATEQTGGT